MNTSAANLLKVLSTLGVRSVSFRVLSPRDARHHTTPVAVLEEEEQDDGGHQLARFSVQELFNAYSLMPRKGSYTLDVEHGLLSFDPPKARRADASPSNAKRWKPKVTRRRHRGKPARAA